MPLLKGKGPTCPVSALEKLFWSVPAMPSDPVICFTQNKSIQPIKAITSYLVLSYAVPASLVRTHWV